MTKHITDIVRKETQKVEKRLKRQQSQQQLHHSTKTTMDGGHMHIRHGPKHNQNPHSYPTTLTAIPQSSMEQR